MNEIDPALLVSQLATGYWVPRCLHAVADLGIADRLDETPQPATALAQASGCDPQALARVLRLLAAHGVFEEVAGGFRHSPASRLLRADHPRSQRSFVRMMGMPVHWAAYGEFEYSLRTGGPAITRVAPGGTFEYLAAHPAESRLFDEAMTAKAHQQIVGVLGAYDFSRFGVIADIGGGRGHLLRGVLAAAPATRGILFDLPHVVSPLAPAAADRHTLLGGDFFKDPLPACDAYLLMSVIHDWGDGEAITILQAARRAAAAHAKLLLIEMLVPDAAGPHPAKLLDIEMLVMTHGGRERTRAEYERLCTATGWRLEKVIPTTSPVMILEAAAA